MDINGNSIQNDLANCQKRLLSVLKGYLPHTAGANQNAFAAMQYACLNGGKRLRPLLVYLGGQLFGLQAKNLDPIAAAVELIHCYSLVHDDLPSMDDDDFRRGKPTCHKAFGEGTAILAGDALLTLAFEILSDEEQLAIAPSKQLKIIHLLAMASGCNGMVKGQAMDLKAEGKNITTEELISMHQAKTGALITASIQAGALASEKVNEEDLQRLKQYGQAVGLAFQIQDDILDALGDPQVLGKQTKQDEKLNKCTFVSLLGLENARLYAKSCNEDALAAIRVYGDKAKSLISLSEFIISRVA